MSNLKIAESNNNNVDEKSFDQKRIKNAKRKIRKKLRRAQIKTLRLVAILVIFAFLVALVLLTTLVILNHVAIGKVLGSIPGAIAHFPIDWLIAGSIGAVIGFLTCGIFYRILNSRQ